MAIVNCNDCGKEIERNTRGHSLFYCDECKRLRKNACQRRHYGEHEDYYREYARENRKKHKGEPISPERAEYLKRDKWKAHKVARDLPQFCAICKTDSHLQAHRKIKNGEYTKENVILLCPKCHKRVHSGVETID